MSKDEHKDTLNQIIEFLEQSVGIDYDALFSKLREFFDFEHGTLFFFNNQTHKLDKYVSTGKIVDLIDEIYFKYGYGLSGWNAKKKRMLLLNNIHTLNKNRDIEICSFLSLPLINEMKLVGVLNLSHSEPDAFFIKKAKELEAIMPLLAGAVEKSLMST